MLGRCSRVDKHGGVIAIEDVIEPGHVGLHREAERTPDGHSELISAHLLVACSHQRLGRPLALPAGRTVAIEDHRRQRIRVLRDDLVNFFLVDVDGTRDMRDRVFLCGTHVVHFFGFELEDVNQLIGGDLRHGLPGLFKRCVVDAWPRRLCRRHNWRPAGGRRTDDDRQGESDGMLPHDGPPLPTRRRCALG